MPVVSSVFSSVKGLSSRVLKWNLTSIIDIQHLTFHYPETTDAVFEDVSLQLDSHWKLGITGKNGSGKTTLLKLLAGKLPFQGRIHKTTHFCYFPFSVNDQTQTPLEISESINPLCEAWKLKKELSALKLKREVIQTPFAFLSDGEKTKVLLAILFLQENSLVLIDEPTNHLDLTGRQALADYLCTKRSFILVSHDRTLLDSTVDHILAIEHNAIEIRNVCFADYLQERERQRESELAQNKQLKKEIKALQTAAKNASNHANQIEKSKIGTHVGDRGYIGHKSAKMMKRAKGIQSRAEKKIEQKSLLLHQKDKQEFLTLTPLTHHKRKLIELVNVTLSYEKNILQQNLSFEIEQGQRIAVIGPNGSGKSSLFKVLRGELSVPVGMIQFAPALILSHLPQTTSHLKGSIKTITSQNNLSKTKFLTFLKKLGFAREDFNKSLESMSQGQKKKVLLAQSLASSAHLYLWDEPLNYLDLESRMLIEQILFSCTASIIFIEHDRHFVDAVATKVVSLS